MRGVQSVCRNWRSGVSGMGVNGLGRLSPVRKGAQVVFSQPVSSLSPQQNAPVEKNEAGSVEEMATVQFRGNKFSVPKGTTLRTALLQNGLSPHNGRAVLVNCRGMGTCGTCAVKIEGNVVPEAWSKKESIRLNLPPHGPPRNVNLRLACSVEVHGDLRVTKFNKFWGQGEEMVGPVAVSDRVTPLGEIEFVLDFRRKE